MIFAKFIMKYILNILGSYTKVLSLFVYYCLKYLNNEWN